MSTALLSSYKKDEPLKRLAHLLVELNWEILASAGTTKYLKESGIAATDIADLVGPPILGHRVVTLSREIHAGLLAATPEDYKELSRLHINPIDLVYVVLYPLEEAATDPKATAEEIIEKTDIGGPALLISAAKGQRVALSSPDQIQILESWLKKGAPESERRTLVEKFAAEAIRRVADYEDTSAKYWEQRT